MTVSVALLLVALPAILETATLKAVPSSVTVVAGVVYDEAVAPGMSPPFFFHW